METAASTQTLSSWRTSPWQRRPRRTLAGAAAIFGFAVLVGIVAGDWMWGAFAAIGLLLATLGAFVPTLYVADDRGLRIHGPLRSSHVRWSEVHGVATEADGAYLTLAAGAGVRTRRAAKRGVTVLLDTTERGAWLKACVEGARTHVARPESARA